MIERVLADFTCFTHEDDINLYDSVSFHLAHLHGFNCFEVFSSS